MVPYFSVFLLLAVSYGDRVTAKLISYSFVVERVPSDPDGFPRTVVRVAHLNHSYAENRLDSRAFPGPTIRAQKGDTVELIIHNRFDGETTSIHFHGLHMLNNPWMDGTDGITQAPIQPMSSFTYRFQVTQTGTYWYHSHSGHQSTDGLLGAIILDYPDNETDPIMERFPYRSDSDSVIILQDWLHENGVDLFTNYKGPYKAFYGFQPNYPWRAHSLLMNGRGRFDCSTVPGNNNCTTFHKDVCSRTEVNTQCIYAREPFIGPSPCRNPAYLDHPFDEFKCWGNHARIRLINGAGNAPFKFWIDRHNLTIVLRDGVETQPLTVESVFIPIGQRLDLIVHCNAEPSKYRMFASVAIPFLPSGANNPEITISVSALLVYQNATVEVDPNPWFPSDENITELFEYQLAPLVNRTAHPAARRIVLQYGDVYSLLAGEPLEEWTTNNITHVMPSSPPLQAVFLGHFSNSTIVTHPSGPEGNVRKTHLLQLDYGVTYEFVIIGINGQQHPWHLHGYTMDFIGSGTFDRKHDFVVEGQDACDYPRLVAVKDEALNKIFKYDLGEPAAVLTTGDSFTVPRFGYSIFRMTATNAGPWLFHCHVDWHLGMGMALIVSVEQDGRYPGILGPPADFPAYQLPLINFRPQNTCENIFCVGSEERYVYIVVAMGILLAWAFICIAVLCCWVCFVKKRGGGEIIPYQRHY